MGEPLHVGCGSDSTELAGATHPVMSAVTLGHEGLVSRRSAVRGRDPVGTAALRLARK